jgi:hypothetical protein
VEVTKAAHVLIGFGLWLAQRKRGPFPANLGDVGRWAVATLNAEQERAEIAKRHAKPSSRRVVG